MAMMRALSVLPDDVPNVRVRADDGTRTLARMQATAALTEQERKRRIAYVIRRARENRELTPPQLAERVGRQRGTVNDWEKAASTPSLVDLGPLCAALGLKPEVFVDLPPIPEDPIAAFLLPAGESGVTEGIRRGRRPQGVPGRDRPARSAERHPRGNGEGPA